MVKRALPAAVALALLVFWGALAYQQGEAPARETFQPIYASARLGAANQWGQLYQAAGAPPSLRPPVQILLWMPLGRLDENAAFHWWIGLNIAAWTALAGWSAWRFGGTGLACATMFLPAALGLLRGSDAVWFACLFAVFLEFCWIKAGKAAGLTACFALFKFHAMMMLPVAWLARQRWRVISGFFSGSLIAFGLSAGFAGMDGLTRYLHLIRSVALPLANQPDPTAPNLAGLLTALGQHTPWTWAVGAVFVLLLLLLSFRHKSVAEGLAAGLAASLLLSPLTRFEDLAVLYPALLAMAHQREGSAHIASALMLIPVIPALGLIGEPWSIVNALSLMVLLASIASDGIRFPQLTSDRKLEPAASDVPKLSATV